MEDNQLTNPTVPRTDKTMDELRREGTYEEPKSEEVTTTVTSVAQEEAKTGQKVELPSNEELLGRIGVAYTQHRLLFKQIFNKLSSKEKNRVCDSLLELPMDDMKVVLKSEEEKAAFKLGQQVQLYRFILIQDKTQKDIQRAKKEVEEEKAKNKPKLSDEAGDLGTIGSEVPQNTP
jgi:hypothetical protein